jgi:hypothetical protein
MEEIYRHAGCDHEAGYCQDEPEDDCDDQGDDYPGCEYPEDFTDHERVDEWKWTPGRGKPRGKSQRDRGRYTPRPQSATTRMRFGFG